MARSTSIRQGLLRNLLLVIVLVGGGIIAVSVYAARHMLETLAREVIGSNLTVTEVELQRFFEPVTAALRTAAGWGNEGLLDDDRPTRLNPLLQPLMSQFPQVSTVVIADSSGREYMLSRTANGWENRETRVSEWGSRTRWHVWRKGAVKPEVTWKNEDYDPRRRPWFQGAMRAQVVLVRRSKPPAGPRIHWTKPYTFYTTQAPGITVALPFGNGKKRQRIIAFDISLEDISRFTSSLQVSGGGGVAVFTSNDRVIGVPRHPRFASREAQREALLKRAVDLGWVLSDEAHDAMASRNSATGAVRFFNEGEIYWGQRRLFPLGPERALWIVVLVPEKGILGTLLQLRTWVIAIMVAVLLIAFVRVFVLSGRYSQPIEALARDTARISQGDLEGGVDIDSNVTEIQQLAAAHERMRVRLRSLVRIEGDLQVARSIQQSALPDRIPYVVGFDIDAFSDSADETGGDTYDVIGYRVDDAGRSIALSVDNADRALLLLADATGHGVGPALSATQIHAMLRMAVRSGTSLEDIVHNVNQQLCDDLFGGRFITAWLAIVDAKSSSLTSFSAGQAPLLHFHADEQRTEILEADAPPFGIMRDLAVPTSVGRIMQPGDIFAVLSDGIFETTNAGGEQFGIQRAVDVIVRHHQGTAGLMVTRLRQALAQFTPGMKSLDDRTALIVKREQP
jgi:serine phosphatase RsbU (regulator of sigma subunit)